jgi:hypothetical protein
MLTVAVAVSIGLQQLRTQLLLLLVVVLLLLHS